MVCCVHDNTCKSVAAHPARVDTKILWVGVRAPHLFFLLSVNTVLIYWYTEVILAWHVVTRLDMNIGNNPEVYSLLLHTGAT